MRMRTLLAGTAIAIALGTTQVHAQDLNLPRPSPKATVSQVIGTTEITMSYSSPGVKGRVIWGELVPYDEVWRTGANEATTFTTSEDVMINGKNLAAGTYALFTVPGKKSWDVVWNSQAEQWGSGNYDMTKDVIRVQVVPRKAADHVERLRFSFQNTMTTEGELVLEWERLKLPVPIKVSLKSSMESVNAAMANYDGERWQTPYQCATFYFDNDIDAAKASEWAELSVKVEETYFNARLMAMMLAKAGKRDEAVKWGDKAVKLGQERENPIDTRPIEKLVAEWRSE
jgi:hypothetical protein